MNIQRINIAYWSYYLLKYAMKCEPYGPIQLDKNNAERLGIQGASDARLQLMSSLIIAKPIYPAEAALACLHIPIVQKNKSVRSIDSKSPLLRTKIVTKSKILGFHPIQAYCNRPLDFENMTFVSYFKSCETEKIQRPNGKCYGIDMFGFYLYETTKLTRFTDFHPTHNTEGIFFNILLCNVCFRDERELISDQNTNKTTL